MRLATCLSSWLSAAPACSAVIEATGRPTFGIYVTGNAAKDAAPTAISTQNSTTTE
jgi:hypothetical protein